MGFRGAAHGPDGLAVLLRRLDEIGLEQLLRARGGRAHAPAEASGDLGTVCVKREQGWESGVTGCHGLQWTMALDIDRRLFLVQTTRPNPEAGPMRLVLAAAACEHGRNH